MAGVDASSIYCYLLAEAEHRDEDTWGIHLLDAKTQGFDPDYTIADAGAGLRAGQRAALGDTPCHGDVFHIQHQCETLANLLGRLAQGAATRRQRLEQRMDQAKLAGRGNTLSSAVAKARKAEAVALGLAKDVKTLVGWLERDILALAGLCFEARCELFNFIVTELEHREHLDSARIPPCASPLRGNATICLALPGCLTINSKRLPNAFRFRTIKSAPFVCCSANPKPHKPTGWAVTN